MVEGDACAALVADVAWADDVSLKEAADVMLGAKDVAEEMEELLMMDDESKEELLAIDDGTRELVIMEELAILLLEGIALEVEERIKLEVGSIVLDSTVVVVVALGLELVVGTIEDVVVVSVVDGGSEEEVTMGATVVLDVVGSTELVVGAAVVVVVVGSTLEGSTELEMGTGAALVVVVGTAELDGFIELEVGSAADVVVGILEDRVVLVMGSAVVEAGASIVAACVVLVPCEEDKEEESTASLVLDVCFSSKDVVVMGSSEDVGCCLVELLVLFSVVESADVVDAA